MRDDALGMRVDFSPSFFPGHFPALIAFPSDKAHGVYLDSI